MRRFCLIAVLLVSTCCAKAQQVETARYEVLRWGKDQSCHFESFGEQGGMMVAETDKTNEEKQRLWEFVALDTSLYDQRSDLIPLPDKLALFDSKSSSRWAVFVFENEKQRRSDSVALLMVTYNREKQEFNTFTDWLPERSLIQSMALIDGNLMLAVNSKGGGGFLAYYDLDHQRRKTISPAITNDYILFQFAAIPETKEFVLAAREFEEKHYKATSFLVYSKEGLLSQSHRFENGENAGLGRMCFAFDRMHQLTVYSTLERESNKKVTVEGMTEDFSKEAVGVTWIKFASGGLQTKSYLFKNLPEIDQALTSSDRLKVKEELLKMQQGKKKEKGEITFQFYAPRLVEFGGNHVFVAEAFQPIYHTETRMDYGYYGYYRSYPVSYTIFDGYDFYSEILLSFDENGELQWHTSVKFENDLCDKLWAHAMESVSHDELLVASPGQQTLRYEVFDTDGTLLLNQQVTPLDFLYGTDSFEDEYEAELLPWYGNCFLVHGCQMVQNPALRTTQRTVFYVQKIQYE
jgi:hypothetical protein